MENLCQLPYVEDIECAYIFWDQELFHPEIHTPTLDHFQDRFTYKKVKFVSSELNSDGVAWACERYGFEPDYYFFHGWAALDWYRGYNRTWLARPFRERNFTSTFLCPNNIIGGKRRHRLELLNELVDRDLIAGNAVSFPERCPYENKTVAELCRQHNIDLGHVDLPLKIDDCQDYAGSSHHINMWRLAENSLLHVVTETLYYGQGQHLTEKTFKPIVMQQPFILASCQGSLEYLRGYGFRTFSEFWDESYDQADDATRMLKIGKLLNDLNNLSPREQQHLQQHLVSTVEHNYNWFYSTDFEELLWNELTAMINRW